MVERLCEIVTEGRVCCRRHQFGGDGDVFDFDGPCVAHDDRCSPSDQREDRFVWLAHDRGRRPVDARGDVQLEVAVNSITENALQNIANEWIVKQEVSTARSLEEQIERPRT